jgi:hypothetical protein
MPDDKRDAGTERGFTVNDRRSAPDAAVSAPESGTAGTDQVEAASGPFPPLDFHTFIISLGSSALLHLGELDPPDGSPVEVDLPLAQHTIDVIAMLQEKTRGNLTEPEAELVESLLFDLRLRYVERSKSAKSG